MQAARKRAGVVFAALAGPLRLDVREHRQSHHRGQRACADPQACPIPLRVGNVVAFAAWRGEQQGGDVVERVERLRRGLDVDIILEGNRVRSVVVRGVVTGEQRMVLHRQLGELRARWRHGVEVDAAVPAVRPHIEPGDAQHPRVKPQRHVLAVWVLKPQVKPAAAGLIAVGLGQGPVEALEHLGSDEAFVGLGVKVKHHHPIAHRDGGDGIGPACPPVADHLGILRSVFPPVRGARLLVVAAGKHVVSVRCGLEGDVQPWTVASL